MSEKEQQEIARRMMKAEWDFMLLKQLLLACSRGEPKIAKIKLKELEKNSDLQDCEIEEIKEFMEKIKWGAK